MVLIPKGQKITPASSPIRPQGYTGNTPRSSSDLSSVGDIYGTTPSFDRIIGFAKGAVDLPRRAAQFGSQIGQAASDLVNSSPVAKTALTAIAPGIASVTSKRSSSGIFSSLSSSMKSGLTQPEFTKPTNELQRQGFEAENLAEFLLPVPGLSVAKTAGFTTRLLAEGTENAAKAAIGSEKIDNLKTDALIGMAFPVIGKAFELATPAISGAMKKLGTKVQEVLVKPVKSDIANGFKVENLQKYDIGGPLHQMFDQTTKKINTLYSTLKSKLATVKADVSIEDAYQKTVSELSSNNPAKFGQNASIERMLGDLKGEVDIAAPNGVVDMMSGQSIKQGAGTRGAWSHGMADPDANARETVYNTFYGHIKKSIEDVARAAGITDVEVLNKQISELIPIQSALIRRMPIADRANVISLGSTVQLLGSIFNPAALALFGADKILKSGTFAKFLLDAAENFKLKGAAPGVYNPASHFLTPARESIPAIQAVNKAAPTGIFTRAEAAKPRLALPAPAMRMPMQDASRAFSQDEIAKMYPNLGGKKITPQRIIDVEVKAPNIDINSAESLATEIARRVEKFRKEAGLMANKEGAGVRLYTPDNGLDTPNTDTFSTFSLNRAKGQMKYQAESGKRYAHTTLYENDPEFRSLVDIKDKLLETKVAGAKTADAADEIFRIADKEEKTILKEVKQYEQANPLDEASNTPPKDQGNGVSQESRAIQKALANIEEAKMLRKSAPDVGDLDVKDKADYDRYIEDAQKFVAKARAKADPLLSEAKKYKTAEEVALAFKEITGDNITIAKNKLAGVEMRNGMRDSGNLGTPVEKPPYTQEQLDLIDLHDGFSKKSPYLFHITPSQNMDSIAREGLVIGKKPRFDGVSSGKRISLSANEELARVFGSGNDVLLRVKKGYVFDNLDADLLAGNGAYTTGKNIPASALEIKDGNKWVSLDIYKKAHGR